MLPYVSRINLMENNNEVKDETVIVPKKKFSKIKNFYNKDCVKKTTLCVLIVAMATLCFANGYKYKEWQLSRKSSKNFDTEKINGIKDLLESEYLYADKLNEKDMTEGAIEGMLSSAGDIYTRYIDYSQYNDFEAQTTGKYTGIGVSVSQSNDGSIAVNEVYKGNGADKAGLQPNDVIIKIDGKDIKKMKATEAIGLIKGKVGTDVTLTVLRNGKQKEIKVERTDVTLPVVEGKMLNKNIAYIQVTSFNAQTESLFMNKYNELKKNNPKGLILDLRDNGGGLLDVGVNMASHFIKSGNIVTIERKKGKEVIKTKSVEKIELPLVVITNQNTASASEIFVGAIKDNKRGTIVGTKTFGKGLVQNTYQVGEDSVVIITTAQYLTPNGSNINLKGITPDVEVQKSLEELIKGNDTQLNKALETIQK